jgi:hypothetical protein
MVTEKKPPKILFWAASNYKANVCRKFIISLKKNYHLGLSINLEEES